MKNTNSISSAARACITFTGKALIIPLILMHIGSLKGFKLQQQAVASSLFSTKTSPINHILDFGDWINHSMNQTPRTSGPFLSHDKLAVGEVFLFRSKKTRRVIPIMGMSNNRVRLNKQLRGRELSEFSDLLTFKDWLRKMYSQNKAIKVGIRTNECVRPVLQHLYASKSNFHMPIIVHANIFEGRPPTRERPVDPIGFIDNVRLILPEASISVGWTPSSDISSVNKLDWSKTFQLIGLLYDIKQPIILNMRLNEAISSIEQIEFLLGMDQPSIYLVLTGELIDTVDNEQLEAMNLQLQRLAMLNLPNRYKVLFDVDNDWKIRFERLRIANKQGRKEKRSVEPERWLNLIFPTSYLFPSTAVISSQGVAVLGWPNSLIISTRERKQLPAKSVLTGNVMFIPNKHLVRHMDHQSGVLIQLYDYDSDLLNSPNVPNSIKFVISHDGKVTIENNAYSYKNPASGYVEKSSAQLPKARCYGFILLDRGWRVEMEAWTEQCPDEQRRIRHANEKPRHHAYVDLVTAPSRRTRNLAIGKVGDGAIDILIQKLEHNDAATLLRPIKNALISISIFHFINSIILRLFF